jgi:hypothetical protein
MLYCNEISLRLGLHVFYRNHHHSRKTTDRAFHHILARVTIMHACSVIMDNRVLECLMTERRRRRMRSE